MARRQRKRRPTRREAIVASSLQPQGGLAQMLQEQGGGKDIVGAAQEIEGMPGGMELLYTVAAEEMMKKQGVSKSDAKKVRLYKVGGPVPYRKGGSTRTAAEQTRRAGRGDDSMMLHVSPEEYEVIESMWGPAETNPDTGIGEYGFLSKVWKKVKKGVKKIVKSKIFQVVAPIALSIFVPGLGAAIGGALGASGTAAGVIGNAVVQGGLGAVSGGKKGFLRGAAMGAVTGGLGKMAGAKVQGFAPGISSRTANVIGTGLASGTASSLTGGDFTSGALMGGLGEYMGATTEGLAEKGRGMLGLEAPGEGEGIFARRAGLGEGPGHATPEMLAAADVSQLDATGGGPPQSSTALPASAPKTDLLSRYGLPLLMGATALSAGRGGEEDGAPPELPEEFGESLPVYSMNREFQGLPTQEDYYTYGQTGAPQSGQHLFMTPEPFSGETGTPLTPGTPPGGLGQAAPPTGVAPQAIPGAGQIRPRNQPLFDAQGNRVAARGGYQEGGEFDYWEQNDDVFTESPSVSARGRYVKGPGTGRSDDIEARLSDGEYVMDAETVALLGDGSGDAGAKRLDEMRRNLRKHKGEKLRKGGFSHKAKEPQRYMARGGMNRLRRAAVAAGRA